MSTSPKNSGQHQERTTSAPRRFSTTTLVSGIVAIVAIIAIIAYAVLHGNRAVPGAAVSTDTTQLPPQLPAGAQAPSFELHSNIGSFSSSQLAGTPYLLEIFATWCPHCQRMTKVLRDIRARVPQSKLAMLSVTGSPYASNATPDNMVPENQADVDNFESTYQVTWPTLFDPDMTVARKFGLTGFPTIFIVDRKGKIVYSTNGEVPASVLLHAIHQAGA